MKRMTKTPPDRGARKKKPSVHTTRVRHVGASPEPRTYGRGSAEAALRAPEEKFRRLFETAQDGIILLEAQTGEITDTNPYIGKLLGYSRRELTGKKLWEIGPFKDVLTSHDAFREFQRKGYVHYEDLPLVTKDGNRCHVELVSNAYRVGNQKVIQCNVRDITERVPIGHLLQESEARYRSLFENMLAGFSYCQMLYQQGQPQDFLYLAVNPAFERLMGLKNVIGKKGTEVIPGIKESDPALFETYGRVASTGQPEQFEMYVKSLGIRFSFSVYSTQKGYFTAVFDNITARKRAELSLQESEQRFREMLENMQLIAVLLDQEGRVTFCNEFLLQVTGYTSDEVLGCDWFTQFVPDVRADVNEAFLQNLQHGEIAAHFEKPIRTKSGKQRFIRFSNTILRDPQGNPIGATSIGEDITEGRRAEARLHRLNRTYALLSDINQTIVRVREPQALFDVACRIAVDKGGFLMAWIGLLDPQTKQVKPVAHAGKTDGYLEKLNITLDDNEHGRGPIATALRAGEHVVVNDIEEDPRMIPWRADALQLGYRTLAAFPLIVAGEVRGTLNLYSPEPDVFDDDELKLLDEMAADIAFALEFTEEDELRQRAELLLRESEERFQTLARISPVGIFRTDPNGATTYVNPKWCDISGLSFDRALGDGWLDAVHPDDKEDLSKGWQESTQLNRASFSDYRFVHPDGAIAWVMGQAVPEMNSENQMVGYIGTITDITKRKRAEAALQASERQLSQMYASISDVLFYLAVEPGDRFRFISVNLAFLNATGLTEDRIVGKLVQEVIPEPALALALGNYKEAIRTKKAVGWEEVSVNPAGKKYGEASVAPILDANGNCTRLIGAVHDITDRKRAEEEIRKLNAQLEQRVKERTARLTAANKDLESFSYSVSHDLRAPLRAINGFASIISRRHRAELGEEGQHYVDNIVQASEQMGHLIDDLLTYSRLGREGVRHAPVPLASLMIEIRKNMQSRLEEIHGAIEIAEGLPSIISDQTLLNQIFTNLLENAITFHKPDLPPMVAITWQIEDDQVIVQVSDNGIGIPAEYQDKIFIMFQRLHSEDEYPGTGIGLANVKKSVELLGGSVWLESKVGEGSTFFVRLPKA